MGIASAVRRDVTLIRGVIFDMDGVLLDSEPATALASVRGMRDFGIYANPEDFREFCGMGEEAYFGGVAEKYGGVYTQEMKDRIYSYYVQDAARDIVLFEGVPEVLRTLHARGYKLAIASGALPIKVNTNIQAAGLPIECFSAIVSAADVQKQKPAPEIFVTAARRMGLEPHQCIVAEDAVSGVTGAKAGGMKCMGITTTFPGDRLIALGADWTADHIRALLALPELA